VKPQDLPSAISVNLDDPMMSPQQKRHVAGLTAAQKAELLDEDSDEEDFEKVPLLLKDIRLRAQQAAAKKRRRNVNVNLRPGEGPRPEDPGTSTTATTATTPAPPSRGPSRGAAHSPLEATPTSRNNQDGRLEDSKGGDRGAALDDGGGRDADSPQSPSARSSPRPGSRSAMQARVSEHVTSASSGAPQVSEEELDLLFLKRYKMSREELRLAASRMGMPLNSLCLVKQEFDLFDEDKSGCIDASELRNLLRKFGEDASNDEVEFALRTLDADGTGEIEFFEFCAWFTEST